MKQKLSKTKLALLLTAITLVVCGIIGTTVAWLIADTAPVVNTFTYGDINITLHETDTGLDGDGDANTNEYTMIPGKTVTKDPIVTVKADSENSWLFVKLEKTANFDDFMTYEIADGWTALENTDGVYYRAVDKADTNAEFVVIKDNAVTVKETVTKQMLNALDQNDSYPKLTVTAYAVQRDDNITTAADAWSKIPSRTNP